nr:E3 ubiquitin-protein ligase AIRP2 [Arachis hypogaea]
MYEWFNGCGLWEVIGSFVIGFSGALGLLRILIYKVYVDGTTTMSTHEMKASIREFYAVIYLSLLQLQKGVTDLKDKKQKAVCMERYRKRDDEDHQQYSDIDIEREEECGICMEVNSKIVLPNCIHAMCLKCYCEWYSLFLGCYCIMILCTFPSIYFCS